VEHHWIGAQKKSPLFLDPDYKKKGIPKYITCAIYQSKLAVLQMALVLV
jgi:hypothetical protein